MPLSNLLEDALSSRLDHISVTRDDPIKVPLLDLRHALVESWSILCGLEPQSAFLPSSSSIGVHDANEELGEDT